MIDRAGSPSAGTPIASSASRQAAGPAPQLTPIASAPARARISATTAGLLPSTSTCSSPNVSEAMTGTSEARRASSTASTSCSRSEKVSRTIRSAPPSSRPSICSRKAARAAAAAIGGPPRVGDPSGPTEPPTSASRPLTSRASRARRAARRLMSATSPSRPQVARRPRLAPNDSVSISSAPASRYSRWAAPTISGWVVTSSSRQARWGTPRLNSSVPRPPSTSSGRAARRLRKRSRGEPAGVGSVIGPLSDADGRAAGPDMARPFLLGRVSGSSLIAQEDLPGLGTLSTDVDRLSWLQRAGPSATLDKSLFSCAPMVRHAAEMSKDSQSPAVRRER